MTRLAAARKVVEISRADTLRLVGRVGLPLVAKGLIVRRPRTVGLLARLGTDQWLVTELRRLRERYGPALLVLRLPRRTVAIPLDGHDVERVLRDTPATFSPASREKEGALSHFQPHGVLISEGDDRVDRRRFTERVLDTPHELHRLAYPMNAVIRQECARLLADRTELAWPEFADAWWRIVRRIVLGDGARDDQELISLLHALRSDGNWSYLRPTRNRVRVRFQRRLRAHLDRTEPGSLAGLVASVCAPRTDPLSQVAHWLFAFDAAGMTAARTVALLATHPDVLRRVRDEHAHGEPDEPQPLRVTRAAVLETLRLWPTTPAILRDSTVDTDWSATPLPRGTTFVVLAPYFHRDEQTLDYANTFTPDAWLDGRAASTPTLLPFSAGPATCPGRNLVLHVIATTVATMVADTGFTVVSRQRLTPLPATLDPFHLRFTTTPHR
ncbi:cytochrome P450 [Actinokineospora iranica]|uniref:Cytochrome P450 n=1 Tax=Actinokineospora iranica TaxID=1271860 RepID=A0A1G6WML3_9PSEU|nr:cytochrome P450 [Actinokineospora iranica]SDD67122.1 Cytochrome P450 [Actinokineospora iranica]